MNVDDLLNQLEDLDFSNKNTKQKQPTNSYSTSGTGSLQKNTYQPYEQKTTNYTSQSNANSTFNKYSQYQEDDAYFQPTSIPTKPQSSQEKDQYTPTQSYKPSNNSDKGLGDIDDLLDILQQEDYAVQKNQVYKAQQQISQPIKQNDVPKQNQKLTYYLDQKKLRQLIINQNYNRTCLNPYLCNGSSDYEYDDFSMRKRVCNALRCSLCNILITKLVDYKWASDVDLLFFRNNFSRKEKLLTKAISDSTYSAYSCQCRGTSVNKLTTLQECNMKEWRCTGHYD